MPEGFCVFFRRCGSVGFREEMAVLGSGAGGQGEKALVCGRGADGVCGLVCGTRGRRGRRAGGGGRGMFKRKHLVGFRSTGLFVRSTGPFLCQEHTAFLCFGRSVVLRAA